MVTLPVGLERRLSDTFGDVLLDAPQRELTVRVGLIRELETTTAGGETEATALRLKVLSLPDDGQEIETAEAKLLVAAVEENARRYNQMVTDHLRDFLAEVREQLKAAKAATADIAE